MLKYELLMLSRPDINQEKQDEIKDKIQQLISEYRGSLFVYDKWGKYLLAYPIQKYTYGVYTLVRFEVPGENINELLEKIKTLCSVRFNAWIMRFVIVDLPKNASAEYCKPDSLEDAPRREKTYGWHGKPAQSGSISEEMLDIPTEESIVI